MFSGTKENMMKRNDNEMKRTKQNKMKKKKEHGRTRKRTSKRGKDNNEGIKLKTKYGGEISNPRTRNSKLLLY